MKNDAPSYLLQRQQLQKQLQQQQQSRQAQPPAAMHTALPEKQHQAKHNPISEMHPIGSHTCDQ